MNKHEKKLWKYIRMKLDELNVIVQTDNFRDFGFAQGGLNHQWIREVRTKSDGTSIPGQKTDTMIELEQMLNQLHDLATALSSSKRKG